MVGTIVISSSQVRKLRIRGVLDQTTKVRRADLGFKTWLILKATPLNMILDI